MMTPGDLAAAAANLWMLLLPSRSVIEWQSGA